MILHRGDRVPGDLDEGAGSEVVKIGPDDRGRERVVNRLAVQLGNFPPGFRHLAIEVILAAAVEIPTGIQTGFEIVEHIRVVEIFGKIDLALVYFFEKIGGRGIAPQVLGIKPQGRVKGGPGLFNEGIGLADAGGRHLQIGVVDQGNAYRILQGQGAFGKHRFGVDHVSVRARSGVLRVRPDDVVGIAVTRGAAGRKTDQQEDPYKEGVTTHHLIVLP